MKQTLNGQYEALRCSRQYLTGVIEKEMKVDMKADMAFSRLHEILSGGTILNDNFKFDYDGFRYDMFLDKLAGKVYLGCVMVENNPQAISA